MVGTIKPKAGPFSSIRRHLAGMGEREMGQLSKNFEVFGWYKKSQSRSVFSIRRHLAGLGKREMGRITQIWEAFGRCKRSPKQVRFLTSGDIQPVHGNPEWFFFLWAFGRYKRTDSSQISEAFGWYKRA